MKPVFSLIALVLSQYSFGQYSCDPYKKKIESLLMDTSADYTVILNQINAYRRCDKSKEGADYADEKTILIYQRIKKQKLNEEKAKNEATMQRAIALKNRDIAVNSASEGLVNQGEAILDRNPGLALKLAYSSLDLKFSFNAINLLRNGIMRNPEWRKITPRGSQENNIHMYWDAGAKENDPIAVDSNINLLLTVEANEKGGELYKKSIVLFDLENDSIISKIGLNSNEEIITPIEMKTRLVAIKIKDSTNNVARIYDLLDRDLAHPKLVLENIKNIYFSNGWFPVFYVTDRDSIKMYTYNEGHRTIGFYPNTRMIWPNPSGTKIVIELHTDIKYVEVSPGSEFKSKSLLTLLSKAPIEHFLGTKIKWVENSSSFIIGYSFLSKKPNANFLENLMAIDIEKNLTYSFYHSLQTTDLFKDVKFDITDDFKRVLFTYNSDSSESRYERGIWVQDIDWYPRKDSLINTQKITKLSIGGKAATISEIKAINVAPNGNYLVVVGSEEGESGLTNTTGDCNLWDLTPISDKTDLAPVPIKISYGNVPIKRIAYSDNSKKILLFDENNISHVFKVRSNRPRIFQQDCSTDDELLDRFWNTPEYIGPDNNFILVRYNERDYQCLNIKNGSILKFKKYINDSEKFVDVRIEGDGDFFIVTTKRMLQIEDGHIIGSATLNSHDHVSLSNSKYIIVNLKNESIVYSNNLKLKKIIKHNINADQYYSWINSNDSLANFYCVYNNIIYHYSARAEQSYSLVDTMNLSTNENEQLYSFYYNGIYLITSIIREYNKVGRSSDQIPTFNQCYKLSPKIEKIYLDFPTYKNEYEAKSEDRYNNLTSIKNLLKVNDTVLCGIFQPRAWNRYVVVWNLKNGHVIKKYEKSGQIISWINSKNQNSEFFTIADGDSLKIYSTCDGEQKYSAKITTYIIKPSYQFWDNSFKLVGTPTIYAFLDKYLLMGGLQNIKEITNANLPDNLQKNISNIANSLKDR